MFTYVYCTAPPPVVPSSRRNTRCPRRDWSLSPPYLPKPSTFSAEENRSLTFGFYQAEFPEVLIKSYIAPPFLPPLPMLLSLLCLRFFWSPRYVPQSPGQRGNSLASMSKQQAALAHNKESLFSLALSFGRHDKK